MAALIRMSATHASGANAKKSASASSFARTTVRSEIALTVTGSPRAIVVSAQAMMRMLRLAAAREGAATVILLAGWYVALLLPTVIFKYVYLAALSGDRSTRLGQLAAPGSALPLWWVHVHDVVPADFLDVLCLVAALWLVGRLVLKIPLVAL